MGRIGFVEVLDRRGRVRDRIALDTLPATIGRGYANDVVLDDHYVSPRHCRLVRDGSGGIVLEDLGSVNGIVAGSDGDARRLLPLASGRRFRLGDSVLRFVAIEHSVPEARPMAPRAGAFRRLARPRLALAAVAVAALVLGLDTYLSTYHDLRVTTVARDVLAGLGALSLWAAAWALANRLLTHRFDYRAHLAWVSIIVVVAWSVSVVVDYIWFLFSAERFAASLDYLANGILFGGLLWGHLAILPAATPRRRAVWALRSAFLFVLISVFFAYSDESDFSTDVPIHVPLKSFGAEWAPAVSVDEFLEEVADTKEWVDTHVERNRPEP